jgi:hypothetical protein
MRIVEELDASQHKGLFNSFVEGVVRGGVFHKLYVSLRRS